MNHDNAWQTFLKIPEHALSNAAFLDHEIEEALEATRELMWLWVGSLGGVRP